MVSVGLMAAPLGVAQDPSNAPPIDAWIAGVTQQLKLTPDQRAVLVSYEALISTQNAQGESLTADQFRAMTFPAQLDFVADQLTQDAAKMRTRAEAARHFYEILTPDQRLAFDALGTPTRGTGAQVAPDTKLQALGPPPNNFTNPSHTNPNWLVTPTADNVSRVYPTKALKRRLSGDVLLACTVDTEGYLFDCEVSQETPPAVGFGNAALEITAYMRMSPATNSGVPVTAPILVPVHFGIPTGGR
ncbi:MAG TPA: TonB family protein [Caulobacteraceae bacterium]|jgi:TonB family protein